MDLKVPTLSKCSKFVFIFESVQLVLSVIIVPFPHFHWEVSAFQKLTNRCMVDVSVINFAGWDLVQKRVEWLGLSVEKAWWVSQLQQKFCCNWLTLLTKVNSKIIKFFKYLLLLLLLNCYYFYIYWYYHHWDFLQWTTNWARLYSYMMLWAHSPEVFFCSLMEYCEKIFTSLLPL